MFANSVGILKKVPPEVPKRTSSIHSIQSQQMYSKQCQSSRYSNGLGSSTQIGSLTSVQSSGSDSSLTSDRLLNSFELNSSNADRSESPKSRNWKSVASNSSLNYSLINNQKPEAHLRGATVMQSSSNAHHIVDNSEDQSSLPAPIENTSDGVAYFQQSQNFKISETLRKRQYRVGLNLFNKKPEKGISYLMQKGFLDNTPQAVAKFLISRKGLSRQMIGEYLGNLQSQFNMAVLEFFAVELDLSGTAVDVALRKFQTYFRMPGEAQKIERLMEVFSSRYCQCNPDMIHRLRSSDTVSIFCLFYA